MAVHTTVDIIADCRAGREAGWRHLAQEFFPAFRDLLRHYAPAVAADTEALARIALALRDGEGSPIRVTRAVTEREFVFDVRDFLIEKAGAGLPAPEPTDWQPLFDSLESLTVTERQTVWMGALGYSAEEAGAMVRTSPETARVVTERAALLVEERLPGVSVRGGGAQLQLAVRAMTVEKPVPLRLFLQAMDGRLGWTARAELEGKIAASWQEVDRYCRVREADAALRNATPLTEADAAAIFDALGLKEPKQPIWKRFLAAS